MDTLGTQELPHLWHLFSPDLASLCLTGLLQVHNELMLVRWLEQCMVLYKQYRSVC